MTNPAKFWDRIAEKYAKSSIRNPDGYHQTMARTRSYLGPQDRVLEVGAGTATTALELAPSVGHVTITDVAPQMIRIGQERAKTQGIKNVEFHVDDAKVGALTGPFDAVLAHNLLHLVGDLPATLDRLHEILKPGGIFISKTLCKPVGRGPWVYYVARAVLPLLQLIGKAPSVSFMTTRQLEQMITEHGFDIIESGHFPDRELRRYIVARRGQGT
ncbi:class I SAM-dependent methyltransferase [Aliiroseovarius sediminis]|uniref:class I SAM-dependent methyltransferase n=1 Tax=Aliiroseovarius sediminis TaxID=2925839 RepID=UPI001F588C74|nr:class I SAM-dependent methyltransferase [Aliiroseovarius sediminis]MCI2394554.1 class I SAM-dependent methyltransferase [Aliiroseovarius sediminis]